MSNDAKSIASLTMVRTTSGYMMKIGWRLVLVVFVAATAKLPAQSTASEHPNVLVLLIDDLGRCDLAVDGSSFHKTPELDALAADGVRFTDFYSAHPVCSPTRAALMTGKAPQRVGITDWIHPNSGVAIPAAETTLGEAFQGHDYQTAYIGKWHLGEADEDQPTAHGFEWIRAVNRAGQPASYYFPYRRNNQNKNKNKSEATLWDVPDLSAGKPGDYLTDALTDQAIEFLTHRDTTRPFLMCFGHYAVHTPIQPPAGLPDQYRLQRTALYGESETPTTPAPHDAVSRARQDNPDYAAMVENLDTNIGRLLASLKELGLTDDTIVVFTSDNGGLCTLSKGRPGPTCNLPYRSGKGWTYEGGIRIPTIVSWPGKLKPHVVSTPGYTADIYPTLLDLCGFPLAPEQHRDGQPLSQLLYGGPAGSLTERPLMWYYPHDHGSGHRPSAAIRKGRWKLVHFLETDRSELYDLEMDIEETVEVARQHPEVAASLKQTLLAWIESSRLP